MADQNGEMTFIELLAEEDNGICIPRIQRDYAQGRPEVKSIRDDFLSAIHGTIVNPDGHLSLDFIYGTRDKRGLFIPLDGQQRLTTLFLLHWYAAVRTGNLDSISSSLSRFSYETRTSTQDFIRKLIGFDAIAFGSGMAISWQLEDQPWFPYEWNEDPSISSMLVMLDSIDDHFSDSYEELWERLVCGRAIVFMFFDIDDLGMTDDIYIKMNSRGLPLTQFEKFKVIFEDIVKETYGNDEVSATRILQKIDGIWTDMFWPYRDEANLIDNRFLRFFQYCTDIICYEDAIDTVSIQSLDPSALEYVYRDAGHLERLERMFDCSMVFSKEYFSGYLAGGYEPGKTAVFDWNTDLFASCIRGEDFGFNKALMLYCFMVREMDPSSIDGAAFRRGLRISRNLIFNSPDIMRGENMGALLAVVRENVLFGTPSERKSAFGARQVEEERSKDKWIRSNEGEAEALYRLEDNRILTGSIAAIGLENHSLFIEADKLLSLNSRKLIHALLSAWDYHQLYRGWRMQLGSTQLEMMRALTHETVNVSGFEGISKAIIRLLELLDGDISDDGLARVIEETDLDSMPKDWRYYFLRYPGIMEKAAYGCYWIPDGDYYEAVIMNTATRVSGNSCDSILYAIVQLLSLETVEKYSVSLESRRLSFHDGSGRSYVMSNRRHALVLESEGEVHTESIPDDGQGYDSYDRVQIGVDLIREVLSGSLWEER